MRLLYGSEYYQGISNCGAYLQMNIQATEKRIQSVGIDIGTSTSHLIFSELILTKDPKSSTGKFIVSDRLIKYRSKITFTPLLDSGEIDIDNLLPYLLHEYQMANIKPDEIDTGAVIITGESAKRTACDFPRMLLFEQTSMKRQAAKQPAMVAADKAREAAGIGHREHDEVEKLTLTTCPAGSRR